ncbi:hypothetical protein PHYBOEH_002237 [Phytophthora boehmeriae]|uniref:Uncharacterized protein n=1 Tax=Phytophthora boehmeriae TaxID=109152 RepID=A0A8T1WTD9_9STRA|nr:hypothetical protein PHYBOEH_002237 [Phytophthora boehmeriae]
MRKNSGDRTMSAALQHRKVSGSFEKYQAEKLHSNVANGRSPTMNRRANELRPAKADAPDHSRGIGLLPSLGVGVALAGSMFVVAYAAVLTAMTDGA